MKKPTPNKVNETTGPVCRVEKAPSAPAPNSGEEPFITKHELARRLHIGVRTVERWQQLGLIPYIKCGRFIYFNWSAVVAHLDSSSRLCRQESLLRIPVIGIVGDAGPKEGK